VIHVYRIRDAMSARMGPKGKVGGKRPGGSWTRGGNFVIEKSEALIPSHSSIRGERGGITSAKGRSWSVRKRARGKELWHNRSGEKQRWTGQENFVGLCRGAKEKADRARHYSESRYQGSSSPGGGEGVGSLKSQGGERVRAPFCRRAKAKLGSVRS